MKINEGKMGGEKDFLVDRPTIELIDCEVQKPVGSGELELRLGTLGAGVIMQPNGNPRILVDIRHPDGTALAAILNSDHLREFVAILVDANKAAIGAQRNSLESTRQ